MVNTRDALPGNLAVAALVVVAAAAVAHMESTLMGLNCTDRMDLKMWANTSWADRKKLLLQNSLNYHYLRLMPKD
jgi:hypothetical protein